MRDEYDFKNARRGPAVASAPGKTRITIRLDDDVVGWFKEQAHARQGANYQSLINQALREHMQATYEPLEITLRRVIREELLAPDSGQSTNPDGGKRSTTGKRPTPKSKS